MATFTDTAGRTWTVAITAADLKRVRVETGVQLGKLSADGWRPLADLADDPETLVGVLYALCQPQADKLGVTPEQFGTGLAGDCLAAAADAFVRAFADFCPSHQKPLLLAILEKGQAVAAAAAARATAALASLDLPTSNASATNSLGSSASTPDRSPSANSHG